MNRLSAVSKELAERLLRDVDFSKHIKGTRYHAMSGGKPVHMTSFKEATAFLHFGSLHSLTTLGGGGIVNYVDFTKLRDWVADVFGDQELAAAINEEIEKGSCYADSVGPIKQLMDERIQQCEEILLRKEAVNLIE